MTKTRSPTRRRYADDDDAFDNGVLRDGHSTRLPLMMRDSLQDDIARSTAGRSSLQDSAGRKPGNRPGFIFDSSGSAARQQLADAYAAAERDLTTAWQRNTGIGAPARSFGPHEGDRCVVNGGTGHWKTVDGELVCVADPPRKDASTLNDREQSYLDHERWLQTAYLNAGGDR